jgi:transposase
MQGQSYFGALSLKTQKHRLIPLDWQDTDNMIRALTELKKQYPHKRICLIWDNAVWHKSKTLREALKNDQPLVGYHLMNFPPYAPDENPEEHVWKYGKEKVANTHFASFADLKTAFTKLVHDKTFNYKI